MRTLSVYITAPYPCRDRAVEAMNILEGWGCAVTSRWLKQDDELTEKYALEDLADVAAADVLFVINPEGWENSGTGGRHVELGYALALGKRIVLLGARSNIFHYISSITVVSTMEEALMILSGSV